MRRAASSAMRRATAAVRSSGRQPGAARGGGGSERVGVAGELAQVTAGRPSRPTSARSPGSPAATPVCAGLTTATRAGRRERGDRRGHHRLADAGPGAGDHETTRGHAAVARCRSPRRTHGRQDVRERLAQRARSASVRSARAVSRSRQVPSGTDGGRKHPTRTPAPRTGARRRRATVRIAEHHRRPPTAARAPRRPPRATAARRGRHGGRPLRLGLQHAQRRERGARAGGASPVSKMNGRAVSTRCAVTAAGPSTAPPWRRAPSTGSRSRRRRPPRRARPRPAARARRRRRRRARAPRRPPAARRARRQTACSARSGAASPSTRITLVGDHQRALLASGASSRVDGRRVAVRHDRDPAPATAGRRR